MSPYRKELARIPTALSLRSPIDIAVCTAPDDPFVSIATGDGSICIERTELDTVIAVLSVARHALDRAVAS